MIFVIWAMRLGFTGRKFKLYMPQGWIVADGSKFDYDEPQAKAIQGKKIAQHGLGRPNMVKDGAHIRST